MVQSLRANMPILRQSPLFFLVYLFFFLGSLDEFTLNLSEMLPYTVGSVTIFSLGTLKNNSKYASKQYVYPVGFKSRKVLYLYNKMYTFTNEIEDGGERGPIFSVTVFFFYSEFMY